VSYVLATLVFRLPGCGLLPANSTASFGGSTAGQRGAIDVVFINNTLDRPVLTFGTYDNGDPDSQPSFRQITRDDEDSTLEPDGVTEPRSLFCGRVFSVGSPALLQLIQRNLPDASVEEEALAEGVSFFDADSEADDPIGTAPPFEALLGVDFPCNSLLVIYLESGDSAGTYRIDFALIPSSSSR
jgi:hypothetical protein